MTSSKRNQSASPNRADRLPPVPISTAARVQPSSASRCADGLAPGRLTGRPDVRPEVLEDDRRRLVHQVVGRAGRRGNGRDPDVHGLRAGIRRDDRVGGAQERLAEQVGHLRLADPGQPVRPRRHLGAEPDAHGAGGRRRPSTSAASRAAARAAPRSPARPAASRTSPGAVPFGLSSDVGRRDPPGLLEVELRERQPAPAPQLAQPGLERPGRPPGSRRTPRRSPRGSGRRASAPGRRSRPRGRSARCPAGRLR